MEVLDRLLELPLWQVPGDSYTLAMIENYIFQHLPVASGEAQSEDRGYILLDYNWQEHLGDFSFNSKDFPQLTALQQTVRRSGRKLALTINPFVSVESKHFKEGVNKKLFVMERNSTNDRFIPALTWFKAGFDHS